MGISIVWKKKPSFLKEILYKSGFSYIQWRSPKIIRIVKFRKVGMWGKNGITLTSLIFMHFSQGKSVFYVEKSVENCRNGPFLENIGGKLRGGKNDYKLLKIKTCN